MRCECVYLKLYQYQYQYQYQYLKLCQYPSLYCNRTSSSAVS